MGLAGARRARGVPQGHLSERRDVGVVGRTPPIAEETGELAVHEWAGTRAGSGRTTRKGYPDPTFSFLDNTEGVIAKTQGGFYWDLTHPEVGYIQDYLNMGVIQPWDTSLISNFADLNPVLAKTGKIDDQVTRSSDWGYSGVIIRRTSSTPITLTRTCSTTSEGKIGWFDTPWILQQAAMVRAFPPTRPST